METFFTMIILDHSAQSHLSLTDGRALGQGWGNGDSRYEQCDGLDFFINSALVYLLITST